MPNMSYCRFENTDRDLKECFDHWDDELSEYEEKARARLLRLCKRIVANYDDEEM